MAVDKYTVRDKCDCGKSEIIVHMEWDDFELSPVEVRREYKCGHCSDDVSRKYITNYHRTRCK